MAKVKYAGPALEDLARIVDFPGNERAIESVDKVMDAIEVLERHPLIGRQAEGELRELVISLGKTGYVALYTFNEVEDVVFVLGIRHQRELWSD